MKPAPLLLALALACGKALAAQSPQVLQRMLAAADTLNYRGHVVQIEGDQAQTLQILHRAGSDGGLDHIRSLQGAYWELRRNGQDCRLGLPAARPAHDEALVLAAFPSLLPRRLQTLSEFYEFAPVGHGRVADRAADFTLARPRDRFRFAYLLGSDSANGLLLKASLIDDHGRVLRQVFFVDVELVPALDEAAWPQAPEAAQLQWRHHTLGQRPAATAIPWTFSSLPPGFSVSGYLRRHSADGAPDIEQLTVSDGLATVSVFIDTPAPGEPALQGAGHVQAMPAFGARRHGRQITALGAAPMTTLKHLVDALAPTATGAPPAALPATSDSP